jgi:ABC-type multidrug transport system fused ATPase/permease subunit
LNKERTVNEPKPPVPFTQQLLEQANLYRQQARDLRAQNTLASPPPNLEAERLDALATVLSTQAIASDAANESARVKANLDKWVGDHKAIADWHNENTKSLISMSQTAIRLQVTINAGAAVALLAFLGNAINKNAGTVANLFASALAVFAAGVAVAAIVAIASYATQFLYGNESPRVQWWARVLHGITFATGFVSLGFFVAGCFQTYDGMRSMAKLVTTGTAQPILSQGPSAPTVPPVQATTEVPDMAKLPPTQPRMANDNAPKPFKTPSSQAQIPPPAPRSPPPPPPAKK